jgi:adenylate kinase
MKIVMLGAPGAGKGTQARLISEKYGIPQISTGDIFRANIRDNTELGQRAKSYMDQGLLVPDQVTCDLVVDRIRRDDCAGGYILDGFPRTIPQAQALTKALSDHGSRIDYAIDVEVPDDNIVQRMSGRRACPKCGATFHIRYKMPQTEGVCDTCGSELIQREDDHAQTVQKRLDVYHSQTQPLIQYYREQGVLHTVDGTREMNTVFNDICAALEES